MKIKVTVPYGKQKAYLRNLIVEREININLFSDNGEIKTVHQLGMEVNKWKSDNGELDDEITFI